MQEAQAQLADDTSAFTSSEISPPSTLSSTQRSSLDMVPVIDVQRFLEKLPGWEEECLKVADCLNKFGILIFRDPRVNEQENEDYIDLMEQYFENTSSKFYAGETLKDAKPEYHYQTGVTPEKVEKARNHYDKVKDLPEEDRARSTFPPDYDAKWRYMWKIGERPETALDNFPQVLPEGFPDWENKMNIYGTKLLQAALTAAEMTAFGMNLPGDTFTKNMQGGSHLLAPTGSDLLKYGLGTTLAGLHYDIALLTVHGKSRFPGLYVWLRNMKKVAVKIPKGCLFIQAGSTFEHITGGYVLSGYHEVIISEETVAAVERAKEEIKQGKERILWRVSSTLFSHMRADVDLSPMPELSHLYNEEEALQKYPKMTSYEHLIMELRATSMTSEEHIKM